MDGKYSSTTRPREKTVDDTVYKLTPGLLELITNKHPRLGQYNSNDEGVYRSSLHRPGLNHSRIGLLVIEHTLRGNGSSCSRKWLYLKKG